MLESKGKAISPKQTLICLSNCSNYDVDTRNQEDVSEFATILVNLIEKSFEILFKLQSSQSRVKDVTASSLLDSAETSGISLPIKNPIVNLLYGEIRTNRKNSGKEKLYFNNLSSCLKKFTFF
jgi:hypothetical protein